MKKYVIISVILILITGSLIFMGITETFSRYQSLTTTNIGVGVAVPIIEDNIQTLTVPLTNIATGESYEFDFYVMNADLESNITDVNLDYYIELVTTNYLPLMFFLQKDGIDNNILNNQLSPTYTLTYNNKIIHNYKLIVAWNSSYTDYQFANLPETVKIIVHATQKI